MLAAAFTLVTALAIAICAARVYLNDDDDK